MPAAAAAMHPDKEVPEPAHARDLAAACLESLLAGDGRWREPADRLTDLAAGEGESAVAASGALFSGVVEPLADRFEPRLADAYVELFSRVLERLGLGDAKEIAARRKRLLQGGAPPPRVQEVVVLSRVTVGADAAVNAPLIAGALSRWPEARILFLGDTRSAALFAGEPRVRTRELRYPRRGALPARLDAWRDLRRALGDDDQGRLILDADTRWTQSGLLPLTTDDRGYCFWESRSYRPHSDAPLGRLAAGWFAERFGGDAPEGRLFLSAPDQEAGLAVRRRVGGPMAAVNFGVGGNESKRVGGGFEPGALQVLGAAGYRVVLDAGWGEDERRRAQAVAEASGSDVELWQGGVGELAGLIAAADLYVGYDSAGAHLAAAAGTRVVDLFAGAVSDRMRRRWTPSGSGPADVIEVETGESPDRVLGRLRELLL